MNKFVLKKYFIIVAYGYARVIKTEYKYAIFKLQQSPTSFT